MYLSVCVSSLKMDVRIPLPHLFDSTSRKAIHFFLNSELYGWVLFVQEYLEVLSSLKCRSVDENDMIVVPKCEYT